MVSFILKYLLIGILITLVMDWLSQQSDSIVNLKNAGRISIIFLWPLMLLIFGIAFFKKIFE